MPKLPKAEVAEAKEVRLVNVAIPFGRSTKPKDNILLSNVVAVTLTLPLSQTLTTPSISVTRLLSHTSSQ